MKTFSVIVTCAIALMGCAQPSSTPAPGTGTQATTVKSAVRLQQIRNATIKLDMGGVVFLVDPMLGRKDENPPFPRGVNNHLRNPLIDLPLPLDEVIKADAVVVTHNHLDHWDPAAKRALPRSIPLFAQNDEDAAVFRNDGFADVRVLRPGTQFQGVTLVRTDGQHGDDKVMAVAGKAMGHVSGVVFSKPGFQSVYVAGDTVWNPHVERAIRENRPDVIVLNVGYARLTGLDSAIIMGKDDLLRAHEAAPKATIVATHLEAVALTTHNRADMREFIKAKGLDPKQVLVPADGESVVIGPR